MDPSDLEIILYTHVIEKRYLSTNENLLIIISPPPPNLEEISEET